MDKCSGSYAQYYFKVDIDIDIDIGCGHDSGLLLIVWFCKQLVRTNVLRMTFKYLKIIVALIQRSTVLKHNLLQRHTVKSTQLTVCSVGLLCVELLCAHCE